MPLLASPAPASTLLRAVQLTSARMTASLSWRLARFIGGGVAVVMTLSVVYLAVAGHGDDVQGAVTRTAVWVAWLGGTLMASWCAADRAGIDRKEGIEALARLHGIGAKELAWSRLLASTLRVSALVAFSSLPVAIAAMAASPSVGVGLSRLLSLLPLGAFALGVGLTAGAVATGCGWLSPRRGRSWLIAVVIVPWSLDGLLVPTRASVTSLPGLLGWLADLITRVGGAG